MFSDLDIVYAYATDSSNYAKQSYQKLVERSIDNAERDVTNINKRVIVASPCDQVREPME